jgi:hypothetical protein
MRRIMRTGSRRPTARAAALVGLTTLAGCAYYQAENKPLTEFPGIQSQIENFYDANATEGDWFCTEVDMDSIDKTQVVRRTASQVRMAVTYYFVSDDLSPGQGGNQCQGFNTRFFTFATGPSNQLTLVSMSGPQRNSGA